MYLRFLEHMRTESLSRNIWNPSKAFLTFRKAACMVLFFFWCFLLNRCTAYIVLVLHRFLMVGTGIFMKSTVSMTSAVKNLPDGHEPRTAFLRSYIVFTSWESNFHWKIHNEFLASKGDPALALQRMQLLPCGETSDVFQLSI